MEIKIDVDEARIIKSVMSGLSKKEIEDNIIAECKKRITDQVMSRTRSHVDTTTRQISAYIDEKCGKTIKESALDYVRKVLTPQKIRSLFKKDDWESFMEDTVGGVLSDFIETALSEWLCLEINVKSKKKTKTIELCGKDSYTFRRK